jgi:hypothetical protein
MTESLGQYRKLERLLWLARWRNDGQESVEEDAILDEMDQVWAKLTANEEQLLRKEGPQCWPSELTSHPQLWEAFGSSMENPWAYEGFRSPEDTILSEDAA